MWYLQGKNSEYATLMQAWNMRLARVFCIMDLVSSANVLDVHLKTNGLFGSIIIVSYSNYIFTSSLLFYLSLIKFLLNLPSGVPQVVLNWSTEFISQAYRQIKAFTIPAYCSLLMNVSICLMEHLVHICYVFRN